MEIGNVTQRLVYRAVNEYVLDCQVHMTTVRIEGYIISGENVEAKLAILNQVFCENEHQG